MSTTRTTTNRIVVVHGPASTELIELLRQNGLEAISDDGDATIWASQIDDANERPGARLPSPRSGFQSLELTACRGAPEPNDVPGLMDIPTLARQLNDSIRHVRRLVAERRIPYLKVGHFIRFDPAEINEWLRVQRVGGDDRGAGPYRSVR
ncbi:MAG: helix-turn-helix domain-containing protein [Actinomycetota bacterium]|nr:helix-turn-helix domain-containing protein [Actinomycetota bacterium]